MRWHSGNDQVAADPRGPHLAGDQWTVKFLPQVIADANTAQRLRRRPASRSSTLRFRSAPTSIRHALSRYSRARRAEGFGLPSRKRAIMAMYSTSVSSRAVALLVAGAEKLAIARVTRPGFAGRVQSGKLRWFINRADSHTAGGPDQPWLE
jgi:hypothetical protein